MYTCIRSCTQRKTTLDYTDVNMYPLSRAVRFFVVIGFSFFVLLLHSIDKRQTYARLELIDVTSGWYHNANSGQNQSNGSSDERRGKGFNSFEICELSYDVKIQTGSEFISQTISENLNLNSESFVIEVGGFEGDLMRTMFQLYEIGLYVVVEPVWKFYNILMKKSKRLPQGRIQPHNIGLGAKDGTIKVKASGNLTSVYDRQTGSESGENRKEFEHMTYMNIIGVERFFKDMGIGSDAGFKGQLDLLILDCEGCEYDVLDYLLTSPNVLHYIRVLMFRPHRFKGHNQDMIRKYCTYQELLPLTHEIRFQNKYSWEVWTLRNKM